MILIDEDRVGEGEKIAFPNMSSCAAGIAVLGSTLVGGHFTLDIDGSQAKTRKLVDKLLITINGRKISRF